MAVEQAARKAKKAAKKAARKTESAARSTAGKTRSTARSAADKAKSGVGSAADKAKGGATRAVATTRATLAARAGRVEDAQEVAGDAALGEGMAADAIAKVEDMRYQVEVNKRGFNAGSLTKALNTRWDNGWRLAHILEQRGNTVLVFEKRD